MTHLVGSTVIVQLTVTDPDGNLVAAAVDLVIQDPEGIQTAEVPVNPSLGIYEFALSLDTEGWWTAIWTATVGNLVRVFECTVCAKASVLVTS